MLRALLLNRDFFLLQAMQLIWKPINRIKTDKLFHDVQCNSY